jgi:hypothetical protein
MHVLGGGLLGRTSQKPTSELLTGVRGLGQVEINFLTGTAATAQVLAYEEAARLRILLLTCPKVVGETSTPDKSEPDFST